MNDSEFIRDYIDQRVKKKTKDPSAFESAYSHKYNEWIVKYCEEKGTGEVPLLLICNTLEKIPRAIGIQNKYFFLVDCSLYTYYYDMNYIFSDSCKQKFFLNQVIKTYIEASVRHNQIDEAYLIARNFPILEDYKDENYWKDETIGFWTKRTDIQEWFSFLHEANHYFFRISKKENLLKDGLGKLEKTYKDIHQQFREKEALEGFLQECYCDENAICYMLNNADKQISIDECIESLYKTIIWLYILQYIDATITNNAYAYNFSDETMSTLSLRLGYMYYVIRNVLEKSHIECANQEIFDACINLYIESMRTVRETVEKLNDFIQDNREIKEYQCSYEYKKHYLEEYLNLIC